MDTAGKTSIAELTARGPNGSLSLSRAGGSKFLEGMIDESGNGVLHAGDRGGVRLGAGLSGNGFVTTLRPDRSFAVAIGSYEGGAPGVRVFDAKGSVVVSELSGDAAGGKLIVGSVPPAQPVLKVAPTVAITDAFVTIGRGSAGHIIRVTDADGSAIATMGEARVGGGVFVAADGDGKTRMLMSGQGELHAVDPGGVTRATVTSEGALSVRNSNNATIVKLSGSPAGNGVFELADTSGNAMVEAGILPTSEGVVRAYPLGGPPGTMLGMPGTMLKGWRGGDQ
jgi:hypothetical protein